MDLSNYQSDFFSPNNFRVHSNLTHREFTIPYKKKIRKTEEQKLYPSLMAVNNKSYFEMRKHM